MCSLMIIVEWLAIVVGMFINGEVLSTQVLLAINPKDMCMSSAWLNAQIDWTLVSSCFGGEIKHLEALYHVIIVIFLFETQIIDEIENLELWEADLSQISQLWSSGTRSQYCNQGSMSSYSLNQNFYIPISYPKTHSNTTLVYQINLAWFGVKILRMAIIVMLSGTHP